MSRLFSTVVLASMMFTIVACQTASKQYNGHSGYQIEKQDNSTATLNYTMSANSKTEKVQAKLQTACQQVLGQKNYHITILNTQEIVAPVNETAEQGIQLGQLPTTFGLTKQPNASQSIDDYATRQALDARPNILKVIRYTCS